MLHGVVLSASDTTIKNALSWYHKIGFKEFGLDFLGEQNYIKTGTNKKGPRVLVTEDSPLRGIELAWVSEVATQKLQNIKRLCMP